MSEKLEKLRICKRGGDTPHLNYIDALKGLCIICVVIGHVAQSYTDSGMLTEANWLLKVMLNATYCFHMPAFFMISGFVFFTAYFNDDGTAKYKKLWVQLLNLIWVYMVFSIAYGTYRIIFAGSANSKTTLVDLLLIPVKPLGVYWYLHRLIIYYIVFMIPGLCRRRAWMVLPVTVAIFLLAGSVSLNVLGILQYTPYFCIGILLARERIALRPWILIPAALSVALFGAFHWDTAAISPYPIIRMAIALGISFGLWFVFQKVSFLGENRFLIACGLRSMEIYVIHTFSTSGCRGLLPFLGIEEAYMSILLNFVISFMLPFAVIWVSQKCRLYHLLFKPFVYRDNKTIFFPTL